MAGSFERAVILPAPGFAEVVDARGQRQVPMREAAKLDRFAAELGAALGLPVVVEEGPYDPVAATRDLVLCHGAAIDRVFGDDDARAPGLAARCVSFDQVHSHVRKHLDGYGVCAAIDSMTYFFWRNPAAARQIAIFGLRAVAERIGGTPDLRPQYLGSRYLRFVHPELRDLPRLLASYLLEYGRSL